MEDPYPTYARLRAAGAVCRGGAATWVVTRHADVAALIRDERLGHRFPADFRLPFAAAEGTASTLLSRILSSLEPPDHPRVRHLVGKALNPSVVRGMRASIAGSVDALTAPLRDRDGFDAVTDLALPLQIQVGCDLLGVPAADRGEIWPRAMAIGRAFIPFTPDRDGARADDDSARWLRDYMDDLVRERRRAPGDDLLSRLIAARDNGVGLSHDEIVDNGVFLFFAGFETAIHLVAGGCAALLAHPDELRRLRADRSLLPRAVEEILRYDAPIQSMARWANDAITIDGRTIRAGRVVLLLLGSANHDERVFDRPERLDVGRHPNPHLSFGGGAHHCLGVSLARLEGAVVYDRLLDTFPRLDAGGPPVRRPHPNLRGYTSVPVAT
jgi:cytochrome P450